MRCYKVDYLAALLLSSVTVLESIILSHKNVITSNMLFGERTPSLVDLGLQTSKYSPLLL